MITKQCTLCGEVKPLDDFHPSKLGKHGRTSRCRPCANAVSRASKAKLRGRAKTVPPAKACNKCGVTKPARAFATDNGRTDGLYCWCKDCVHGINQRYYSANAERIREVKRAQYRAAPEKQAKRRAEKREQISAYGRSWYQRNKVRHASTSHANYLRQKPAIMDRLKRRRLRKRGAAVEVFARQDIWERDGGVCHLCGRKCDPADWHMDHIIPLHLGGPHCRNNVAVAHPTCNKRKGWTGPGQLRLPD